MNNKEKATRALTDALEALSNEVNKELISPNRVAALAQAISALVPLVTTSCW